MCPKCISPHCVAPLLSCSPLVHGRFSSMTSTRFSLGFEVCFGVRCMNSCMSLCCLWFTLLLHHVSSLVAWFRRFLLFRPSLLIVHASSENRTKSPLRLALPQHVLFRESVFVKSTHDVPAVPPVSISVLSSVLPTSPIFYFLMCSFSWHVVLTISAVSCCLLLQPLRHVFCKLHFATLVYREAGRECEKGAALEILRNWKV